jgi:hypothetical protein
VCTGRKEDKETAAAGEQRNMSETNLRNSDWPNSGDTVQRLEFGVKYPRQCQEKSQLERFSFWHFEKILFLGFAELQFRQQVMSSKSAGPVRRKKGDEERTQRVVGKSASGRKSGIQFFVWQKKIFIIQSLGL